jgi:hypothetical protein
MYILSLRLYLWNLCKILRLLIPMKSMLWKKILDPYIVHVPKRRDQWSRGHWVKQIFFAIFGTFGRYVTNLRGTFVENVKKVQNQPTLVCTIYQPMYCIRQNIQSEGENLPIDGKLLHSINIKLAFTLEIYLFGNCIIVQSIDFCLD